MKLWHCAGSRSLRPLWALEEMGLDYDLEILPFPPRVFKRDYLDENSLGTVPYFVDGDVHMTESSAICQYLVDRYQQHDFGLQPDHPEYGAYLNWLHHADATLTFPQTISMRYYYLEPTPEKQAVADDYAKWFIARLRRLNAHLENHEYLVDNRFTVADIAICYALIFAKALKLDDRIKPQTLAYMERLIERPGYVRAHELGEAHQMPEQG
ncbi:MAG: glutathione S-transferase family protein [Halieaceae bacterium]|nr:glutathione S-transferase family protein [Halieaceae bacterium]